MNNLGQHVTKKDVARTFAGLDDDGQFFRAGLTQPYANALSPA